MIDFDGVVELQGRDLLPQEAGVYFLCDIAGNVLYIGKSVNIYQRWRFHHRFHQAQEVESVVIKWKCFDPTEIDTRERYFIETLSPEWNNTPVGEKPEIYRQPKSEMEKLIISFDDADIKAIAAIRNYYGASSKTSAVRLALREMERRIKQQEKHDKE